MPIDAMSPLMTMDVRSFLQIALGAVAAILVLLAGSALLIDRFRAKKPAEWTSPETVALETLLPGAVYRRSLDSRLWTRDEFQQYPVTRGERGWIQSAGTLSEVIGPKERKELVFPLRE